MHDLDDPGLDHYRPDTAAPAVPRIAPGRSTVTSRLPIPARIIARAAHDAASGVAADAGDAIARAARSSGLPLPGEVRSRFESSLGVELSGVRVHTGGDSAAAARAVGARAFATGNDIHFAQGAYAPADPFGLHLLAHEVAHTVQQAGSAPGMQYQLEVSSPGDAAELEADHAAARMVAGEPVAAPMTRSAPVIARQLGGEGGTAPQATVLDNGEVTADTEVMMGRRRVTLRAGTYVEVLRGDATTLHVRAYSGWHGQECDIPRDRFHQQPEISNRRGRDGTATSTPRDDVSYREIHGGLYGPDGAPHLTDIDQGELGDCYFMTALGTVAQSDPASIQARIRPAGPHSFTVTFFADDHGRLARPITVDDHFPVRTVRHQASGDPVYGGEDANTIQQAQQRPLWALVLEKAYAQYSGGYQELDDGRAVGGGGSGTGGSLAGLARPTTPPMSQTRRALIALTGRPAHDDYDPETHAMMQALTLPESPRPSRESSSALRSSTPDLLLGRLREYLDGHIPVVLGTPQAPLRPNATGLVDPDPAAPRVYTEHAYDVRDVDVRGRRITLFNPWNQPPGEQPRPMTPEEVQRLFDTIIIGTAPPPARATGSGGGTVGGH